MQYRLKDPCKDCPFRKNARPGWIGTYENPLELHREVSNEVQFPCHLTINWRKPVEPQLKNASYCAGFFMYANNTCKKFRDPAMRAYQEQLGKSDQVFDDPREFMNFHTREPVADGKERHAQDGNTAEMATTTADKDSG